MEEALLKAKTSGVALLYAKYDIPDYIQQCFKMTHCLRLLQRCIAKELKKKHASIHVQEFTAKLHVLQTFIRVRSMHHPGTPGAPE